LRALVARYEYPSLGRSSFQIVSSVGLFAAACAAMYWSLQFSYVLTLLLAVPAAGLLVRTFIVQHDCGHGAFFKSRRANDLVGMLCSIFTFTPYAIWRRHHNGHHADWNNLDSRAGGTDIYSSCMTVEEYRALSARARFIHRAFRHPVISQVIVPPLIFFFVYRIPYETPKSWRRERLSVYLTNLVILAVFGTLAMLVGIKQVLMVQLPIVALTSIIGVWLFSLQHRFDGVVWARKNEWSVVEAAVLGSSYLKLPRVLQWFTGNIGFHHVHHLLPRVPNYRLEECHAALMALVGSVKTLTLGDALRAPTFALWDEAQNRMVPFPRAA
jgi:omega-6 fatty acid desaturase (delta-12 desaturase)